MAEAEKSLPRFSKRQLGTLYGLAPSTVNRRLKGALPAGKCKRGYPLYTLPAVSHLLGEGQAAVVADSDAMDPANMPPDMAKDYWDAELKRQKFEQNEGDLWPTDQVLDLFSGLLKPLAFALRSLPDNLERRGRLTPKQLALVQQEVDGCLKAAHDGVLQYAGGLPPTD